MFRNCIFFTILPKTIFWMERSFVVVVSCRSYLFPLWPLLNLRCPEWQLLVFHHHDPLCLQILLGLLLLLMEAEKIWQNFEMQLPSQIGWRFYSRRIARNVQYRLKICVLNWFPSQLSVFLKNKKKNQTGEIKWLQYSSRFNFACNFILWDYVLATM